MTYKAKIVTMGRVYMQDGRENSSDAEIEIRINGIREEDLKHFISPTLERKKDKDITGGK